VLDVIIGGQLAGNGHGLAMWWHLKIVRPEPQPNKSTKAEANKQKPNRITSAETAADSDKMPKLTTSSHHIAKPPVGSRAVSEVYYAIRKQSFYFLFFFFTKCIAFNVQFLKVCQILNFFWQTFQFVISNFQV
jgi:hypothetical protein